MAFPKTSSRDFLSVFTGSYVEEALRWLPDKADQGPPEERFENQILIEQPLLTSQRVVGPGKRGAILIADDNADMRDYLRRLLSAEYETRTVPDGEAALAALREAPRPDLVLSDVVMPRLDGFGLLRAIRADRAFSDLPVILLSARAGEEASIEGMEAGADDYLVKPFSARELLARVAANLEMARLRGHNRRVEESVRAAEERLRAALLASGTGTFRWDLRANTVEADEALDRLFGLDPNASARSGDQLLARVHASRGPNEGARAHRTVRQ